jgi:hypothetical protein
MKKGRGYFPSSVLITKRQELLFDGILLVVGGKTREDKVSRYCEKYDLS